MADKTLACKGTDQDSFCENEEDFNWDSEDEREIENCAALSSSSPALVGREAVVHSRAKASSLAGSSGTKLIDHFIGMGFSVKAVAEAIREYGEENSDLILEVLLKDSAGSSDHSDVVKHFVGMGFSKEMVAKVIQEHGDSEKTDSILETLLTYSEIERHPQEESPMDSDRCSTVYGRSFLEDFSDLEDSVSEAFSELESDEESGSPLACLTRMGYTKDEASIAIERCGAAAPLSEPKPKHVGDYPKLKKRSLYECDIVKRNKQMRLVKNLLNGDDELLRLANPMIGFGVPTEPGMLTQRTLPEAAKGPPFFYYENVALAPKGVWQTISRCLYDVEPEFVDSKYFCAAARKRGYVHNLPIHNRFPLLPLPKLTIHEAFPLTKRWWPLWDPRTKLNCLQTSVGSAKLTERIRKAVEEHEGVPPLRVQEYVLNECRKWNLVWVGKNKVAPLEPDEFELLLGFPRNHTRGGGISRTDRYKSLGNSFQVDTVAYHLSALKDLFPDGISILSLFSGIGGAEVALYKLGIRLKNVVSVEISEVNRGILRCWWEQTNQTGNLIDIPDVQQLDGSQLEELMSMFGGFDLVVGGSPCNNLAGSNGLHRVGLEGKESSLFYDYCRILDLVKRMMNRNR